MSDMITIFHGGASADQWRGCIITTSSGDRGWVLHNTPTCLTLSLDSAPWYRRLQARIPFLFTYQLPLELRSIWRNMTGAIREVARAL